MKIVLIPLPVQRVIKKENKEIAWNHQIANEIKTSFDSDHEWELKLKNFQTSFDELHE